MTQTKRKSFLNVSEANYALADELSQMIGQYKYKHKLSTMIEALAAMLRKIPNR